MLVRRTDPVPMECIARGYLFGGAWAEYREHGTVQGRPMPAGMREAEQLPEPLFTPTTKAESGHDLPMTDAEAIDAGRRGRLRAAARRRARDLRARARRTRRRAGSSSPTPSSSSGSLDGELLLIDEVLTPDSSRYWPAEDYAVGGSPPSFDKQYVRDYYLHARLGPDPARAAGPGRRDRGTRARYVEAYERLTGKSFADWYGG